MNFNLKGWKKIHEAKDHAILQHPTGHQLRISKTALSPEMGSQLNKLPIQKFAHGGDAETNASAAQDPTSFEDVQSDQPIDEKTTGAPAPQGNYAPDENLQKEASKKTSETIDKTNNDYQNKLRADKGLPSIEESEPTGGASGSWADDSASPVAASVDTNAQQSATMSPQQMPSNDPFGINQSFQGQINALNETKAGQQQMAQAQGNMGAQEAGVEQQYQTEAQKNLANYQKSNDELSKERVGLQNDIATGHINPKQYLENMSTGKKITSGIGLILGGMGAGLTHGPNLAFQYLQNQIDRDIQSQRDDLGKKESLLSHNLQATNNLRAATDMTRLQSNDILSSHLKQLAGTAQSEASKGMLLTVAGNIDGQTAKLQHDLALQKMQNAAFSGNGTPSSMALENLPGDKRERIVQMPAGGIRLALTKDGAKELNTEIGSIKPIFDQLDQLGKLGSSALIPGSQAAQQAEAIRSQLGPAMQEAAGFKRLSDVDLHNNLNMINDPEKFSQQLLGNQAKTNAYKSYLQNRLVSHMGSQLEGGYTQQPQAQGPQFKVVDGVKWMRGPNGEAVRVK